MTPRRCSLSRTTLLTLFLLSTLANACRAFEEVESLDPAPCPVELLEEGRTCFPHDLARMASDGTVEDLTDCLLEALVTGPMADGTWIYAGNTARGTVKAIVQRCAATVLAEEVFGFPLEIKPETHPVDIRPSQDAMAKNGSFRFSLYSNGEAFTDPVRYTASRRGRENTADPLSVSDRETSFGRGTVQIDEPGLWWVTAEREMEDGYRMLASITFVVPSSPGPDHFAAFTSDGDYLADPDAIAAYLDWAEVIFLGEQHTDPVAHYLEKEILAAVHRSREKVALTLEMFERDVQPMLDCYLSGDYEERHFLKAARPWPHYETDYRPMVEYAKAHGLPVIAGNAPRRLVNFVSRRDPDALAQLPESETRWLPPLDYYVPTEGRYVEKLNDLFLGFEKSAKEAPLPGPRTKRDWVARGAPGIEDYNEALLKDGENKSPHGAGMPPMSMMMHAASSKGYPSQSLWDATMAYSIAQCLKEHPGYTVVQVNGAFHSDEHLGTVEQLERYRPKTRTAVISLVPDERFPAYDQEAFSQLGDVVIVIDPSWMPEE